MNHKAHFKGDIQVDGAIVGGAPAPVILDPSILPDGVTENTPFGYLESGGIIHFFGRLLADGVSDACLGNVPLIPLEIEFPGGASGNTGYYSTNIDGSPFAETQVVAVSNNGIWATDSVTGVIYLGNISFVGSITPPA